MTWAKLQSYKEAGFLMSAVTGPSSNNSILDETDYWARGINPHHAYTILSFKSENNVR